MLYAAKERVKRLHNAGRFCDKEKKREKKKKKQKVGVPAIESIRQFDRTTFASGYTLELLGCSLSIFVIESVGNIDGIKQATFNDIHYQSISIIMSFRNLKKRLLCFFFSIIIF